MLWQVELGPHLGAVRHTPGKLPNTLLSISLSLSVSFSFSLRFTLYSLSVALSLGLVISFSLTLLSLSLPARPSYPVDTLISSLSLSRPSSAELKQYDEEEEFRTQRLKTFPTRREYEASLRNKAAEKIAKKVGAPAGTF